MGLGGISGWQILILLVIVLLVFGTKRLRNVGSDLGTAIKGFKKGLQEDDQPQLEADPEPEGDRAASARHEEDREAWGRRSVGV